MRNGIRRDRTDVRTGTVGGQVGTAGFSMLESHLPAARERIRVLFVMMQMAMGGSERLVFNLVRSMDRSRFAPSIVFFAPEQPLAEFEELQVPLHYVPKQRRVDWATMRHIARIVREERIDVVNAHHFMPFVYSFYAAKVANRARLVYTEHSEADVAAVSGKWQPVGCRLLRWSDGAIGISGRVAESITSHFALDAPFVHAIANGVDCRVFAADPAVRSRLRRELALTDGDVVLGHVANFRHNKNHLFLLRAVRELARTRPDVKLLLVGQGFAGDPENSGPDIARFIEANGLQSVVRTLGYRPDVQDVLKALDVFCLVSHKEGLPLSLVEAMATGIPVVATDIESIRQVVEPGTVGSLVAPDDVHGLVAALHRLIDDESLRQRMGAAGAQVAARRFSLARCVDQTQELFASLVTRKTEFRSPSNL